MSKLNSGIVGFILTLIFAVSASIVALGLLTVALIALSLSVLKALITGRKPAPLVAFSLLRQFSQQGMRPAFRRGHEASAKAATGQVVDVEVREIRDEKRLP